MVAVVDVGVAATPLIQDCAKAEGATRKTKRRGTDTTRTRINLHMAQYRNDPQPEEPGGALHPFLKNLSKSCNSIIGRAERSATRDVLVIGTLNLRIFREWEVRSRSGSALRSDSLDRNSPISFADRTSLINAKRRKRRRSTNRPEIYPPPSHWPTGSSQSRRHRLNRQNILTGLISGQNAGSSGCSDKQRQAPIG